jgi:hypothetical protein
VVSLIYALITEKKPLLNAQAEAQLRDAQSKRRPLETGRAATDLAHGSAAGWAVALFGVGVLAHWDSALGDHFAELKADASSDGGGDGSGGDGGGADGGCGGGGCGGGGCGGGGCGGGGCGGCGG